MESWKVKTSFMSRTRFRVNPHSIVAWMSRNFLLEAGAKSEVIWPAWLNGWVFVYELSGCGFESSCNNPKICIENKKNLSCKLLVLIKINYVFPKTYLRIISTEIIYSFIKSLTWYGFERKSATTSSIN